MQYAKNASLRLIEFALISKGLINGHNDLRHFQITMSFQKEYWVDFLKYTQYSFWFCYINEFGNLKIRKS